MDSCGEMDQSNTGASVGRQRVPLAEPNASSAPALPGFLGNIQINVNGKHATGIQNNYWYRYQYHQNLTRQPIHSSALDDETPAVKQGVTRQSDGFDNSQGAHQRTMRPTSSFNDHCDTPHEDVETKRSDTLHEKSRQNTVKASHKSFAAMGNIINKIGLFFKIIINCNCNTGIVLGLVVAILALCVWFLC